MSKNLVVKSNTLNQITFYNSIIQLKVFSKIILEVRKDRNKEFYKFLITDLINEFNFSKEHYGELKNVCKKMFIPIELPSKIKNGFSLHTLFYRINTEEKGYISFKINPDLKPYILEQTKNFTSYFIENIAHLKSGYSLRIYELLKQYQNKTSLDGWYKVELETLKDKLNIDKRQYKLYGHFKAKVLNIAQKELKLKTDLIFDFEEIKRGRKVEIIVFHLKPNKKIIAELKVRNIKDESLFTNQDKGIIQEPTKQDQLRNTDIYKYLVKEFNLNDSFIQEIFTKYDKERLKRNFEFVSQKLKNNEIDKTAGGFLREALKNDYANQKSIKYLRQEKQEQESLLKQQEQEIIDDLKKSYDTENKKALYNYLLQNKINLEQEFKTCLEQKPMPSFFIKDIQETLNKRNYQEKIKDITKNISSAIFRIYLYQYINIKSFEAFSKAQGYTLAKKQDITGQEHYIIQEKQTKNNIFFKT